jgi:hypothetical protein
MLRGITNSFILMGVNGEKEGLQTLPYLGVGRRRGYKFIPTCGEEEGL